MKRVHETSRRGFSALKRDSDRERARCEGNGCFFVHASNFNVESFHLVKSPSIVEMQNKQSIRQRQSQSNAHISNIYSPFYNLFIVSCMFNWIWNGAQSFSSLHRGYFSWAFAFDYGCWILYIHVTNDNTRQVYKRWLFCYARVDCCSTLLCSALIGCVFPPFACRTTSSATFRWRGMRMVVVSMRDWHGLSARFERDREM